MDIDKQNACTKQMRDFCYSLKEGQAVRIGRHEFQDAFPCGGLFSIYRTHEQAFLSGMVGSMWGTFKVSVDLITGHRTVSRHAPGDKMVYIDPDREHLVETLPDGTLQPFAWDRGR